LFFNSQENLQLEGLEMGIDAASSTFQRIRLTIIIHSLLWKQLKYVDLKNWVSNKSSLVIMQSHQNKNLCLESFAFSTEFNRKSASMLNQMVLFKQLKKLKIPNCKIDSGVLSSFMNCEYMQNLEFLDVSFNKVNDEAAKVLSQCGFGRHIKTLVIKNNPLGDRGFKHLLELRNLDKLNVLYTGLTGNALKMLIKEKKRQRTNVKKVVFLLSEVRTKLEPAIVEAVKCVQVGDVKLIIGELFWNMDLVKSL